jgi:hypothetical protein
MSGFKLANDSFPRAAPDGSGAVLQDGDQALGLTVHSMPSPQQTLDGDGQRTATGRWKMILVLLVCAAPVIASYFMYYVVRPDGRRNFGELIDPQRPLPDQPVVNLAGQAGNLRALKGQWLLVSVAGGACDEACTRHLYLQRQLRESLGKNKDRLDWVWLVSDDQPVQPKLREALEGSLSSNAVLRVPQQQLATWLQPAPGRQLAEHLYVVDPMGNWMLRFPAALDLPGAAKAKRDIERLLRASDSWDQPGRQP